MTKKDKEQTTAVLGSPATAKRLSAADVILPSIKIEDDGVEFINIYEHSRHPLGRMASPVAHMPFVHPTYASFNTLQGFWEWIKSEERPDALRYLTGKQAVGVGRGLNKCRFLDDFQAIIEQAVYCMVDQNEKLLAEFLRSNLPFEMYYVNNPNTKEELPVRTSNREIIVSAFTHVREMMWNDERPVGFEHYKRPSTSR